MKHKRKRTKNKKATCTHMYAENSNWNECECVCLKTESRVEFQFHLKEIGKQAMPCLAKNDMTFTQNKSICKHVGFAPLLDHRSTDRMVQFC